MWKIQKNGVPQTLVEFSIMKDSACTKPILLKGSNIVSKVYYDPNEGMLFYLKSSRIFKMLLYAKVHILHTLSFIVLQKAVYKETSFF